MANDSAVLSNSISLEPLFRGMKYIPGILLLLAIGLAGKTAASYIPHTEYVLFAIAFGAVVSNVIPIPRVFVPGLRTYEFWLKAGIVLMGSRLAIQNVLQIGGTGLFLVITEIIISIATAKILAKFFHLSDRLGSLIGIGVGICGVSAIIGATGAINAEEEDATYAIATILIFGAVMVFLYPLIGELLGMSHRVFGFWAGLPVDKYRDVGHTKAHPRGWVISFGGLVPATHPLWRPRSAQHPPRGSTPAAGEASQPALAAPEWTAGPVHAPLG